MVAENLNEKQDMLYDTSLRLEQTEKEVSEAERQLSDTKMELDETEKDLIQIKTESRETKQKLMAEQEEIKQENLSLKTDTLTSIPKKKIFYMMSAYWIMSLKSGWISSMCWINSKQSSISCYP